MDMLSTSKGPTRHGQGRSPCAWASRCWSRVVRCGSGRSGGVGTTRERPCHAFFWIGLLGHSLIGRFTRRSNHIHNKIPSYCDLRRHGALVHGDWYVLVSDPSKRLDGTLLCGYLSSRTSSRVETMLRTIGTSQPEASAVICGTQIRNQLWRKEAVADQRSFAGDRCRSSGNQRPPPRT